MIVTRSRAIKLYGLEKVESMEAEAHSKGLIICCYKTYARFRVAEVLAWFFLGAMVLIGVFV